MRLQLNDQPQVVKPQAATEQSTDQKQLDVNAMQWNVQQLDTPTKLKMGASQIIEDVDFSKILFPYMHKMGVLLQNQL